MKLPDLYKRLARAQVAHPWWFLCCTAIVTAVAGVLAAGLEFDSSYYALLPTGMQEPRVAKEVRQRTGGTRQLVIAIEGEDPVARLEFGRELERRIRDLEAIRCSDVEFPVVFFEDRGLWLLDVETLGRLVPALEEAVRIARWQANPLALHLDEEEEERELEAAWQRVDDIVGEEKSDLPFDGVLTSEDGRFTFLLVIPSIELMDISAGKALFASIDEIIEELDPAGRGVRVRLAGTIKVFHEQHQTMLADLRKAAVLALVFGILIVALFTRKPVAPFIIGAALLTGIVWTFALARLMIGHLNVITGFLVAVLIGLGIDFSIHILIRYQQERSMAGKTPAEALLTTVTGTLPPAMTSALTTAGAFFACMIAEFKGFFEFGLISGVGVLLTLASSFLVLPTLLYVIDRRRGAPAVVPVRPRSTGRAIPALRFACFAVVAAGIGWAAYGGVRSAQIPFRNNFKELRGTSEATEFFDYVDENLGFGFNPAIVITRSIEDAREVEAAAIKTRDERVSNGIRSRIHEVFSLASLLPEEVDVHAEHIEKLREMMLDPKLDRAERKEGERAEQLTTARRMVGTEPWTVEDIPEQFTRRLTTLERDGFLVFIWPTEQNDSDRLALSWEEELGEVAAELTRRRVEFTMADETLMPAWIYRLITADALPMLLLATLVVMLFIALDFRSLRRLVLVSASLGAGMLGFMATVHVLGMEFNMFNLVVIPCVIGIGVDNVVHITHRYLSEGPGSVGFVVRRTGVAALLASLTTAAGFGSSLTSHHLGLRTLGSLAIVGIGFTLLTAAVFFPCLLAALESLGKSTGRRS